MKKIYIFLLLFFILFFQTQAAFYEYNVAWVSVDVFNKWAPIYTPNSAWVVITSNIVFSWWQISSTNDMNIAGISVATFNSGNPIYTFPSALVKTNLISQDSISNIKNDQYGNIAGVWVASFNNGSIIYTPISAKVEILKYTLNNSWVLIKNNSFSNIAGVSVTIFNNGATVITPPSAAVSYSISWSWNILLWENDTFANIAGVSVNSFNNGTPINTTPTAIVSIKQPEINTKIDQYVEYYDDPQKNGKIIWDYTNPNPIIGLRTLYINSKNHIFMWKSIDNIANLWVFSLSWGVTKNIIKWNQNDLVIWDNKYFQKIIKTDFNNKKLDVWDTLNIALQYAGETNYYLNQEVFIVSDPLPPILTYPYYTAGTWVYAMEDSYLIKNTHPTIKWLALPNSIIEWSLQWEKYYIQTDNEWNFSFQPKKLQDSEIDSLVLQYKIIGWTLPLKNLSTSISYTLKIRSNESYTQPYISNIYNDDDIYSDVIYLEWYANSGVLNYNIKNIEDTQIIYSWSIIVWNDKNFEILILETDKLPIWKDYILEMWNEWWNKERKAFSLVWNTSEKIGILNYSDYDISPTKRPIIMWYGNVNELNNSTIRGYACEIGTGSTIDMCPPDKKFYVGSTNADKNGMFIFETLPDLKDGSIYLFDFYNTNNLSYHKNIILKIDIWEININKSQITNLFSGIKINTRNIQLKWFTLSWATIEIKNSNDELIHTGKAGEHWSFTISIYLPIDGIFKIIYTSPSGWKTFEKIYKLNYDTTDTKMRILDHNYFQEFNESDIKIIDWKVH